ncbi:MAG TPA: hypothetical protein VF760_08530, partial [Xanthobacteraceae bacterium]
CYIITLLVRPAGQAMTHHHHHQDDVPHPSAAIGASLLRLSATQRLTVAGIVIALLWAAFWWAIR